MLCSMRHEGEWPGDAVLCNMSDRGGCSIHKLYPLGRSAFGKRCGMPLFFSLTVCILIYHVLDSPLSS